VRVQTLVTKLSMIRLGAFASVLLLSTGLLVTLFDEAQAAEIQVEDIGTMRGVVGHIHVDIVIPAGYRVPIEAITGVIETRDGDQQTKTSNSNPELVAIGTCNNVITGCPSLADIVHDPLSLVDPFTAIRFEGANVDDDFFGYGGSLFEHIGGYGYHSVAGYGYGGILGPSSDNPDQWDGYGYGLTDPDQELIMSFRFTVNTVVLGNGDYWFTALAETPSGLHGTLSSPATPFTVNRVGGGIPPQQDPGSGGGGEAGPISVDAGRITAPDQAREAWEATISGNRGDQHIINIDSDIVPRIQLDLQTPVRDARVEITVWPREVTPPGLPDPGFRGAQTAYFIQVSINGAAVEQFMIMDVQLSADDLQGDPGQAFMARHENPWVQPTKLDLTYNEETEKYEGTFEGLCCTSYMVGFLTEGPLVDLVHDDGAVEGMGITFSAILEDPDLIDRVEFYLDDVLVHTAHNAPFIWNSDLPAGEYNVRAIAYDIVGNSSEAETQATVQEAPRTVVDVFREWVPVVVIVAVLAIIGLAITYYVRERKAERK
jgi:hypothetical protein